MGDFINEMKMSCSTCRFCVQQECRRYPPIVAAYPRTGFPAIYETTQMWCGEYQSAQQYARKEVQ
jgi:hypothetical protein